MSESVIAFVGSVLQSVLNISQANKIIECSTCIKTQSGKIKKMLEPQNKRNPEYSGQTCSHNRNLLIRNSLIF